MTSDGRASRHGECVQGWKARDTFNRVSVLHGEAVRVSSVGSRRSRTPRRKSLSRGIVQRGSGDARSSLDDPVKCCALSVGAAARRPTAIDLHGFAVKDFAERNACSVALNTAISRFKPLSHLGSFRTSLCRSAGPLIVTMLKRHLAFSQIHGACPSASSA